MSIVAEIVRSLELAQAGAEVRKADWFAVLEAVPYMNMVSDENVEGDEILWGCFCRNRAQYELNLDREGEDVFFTFYQGNRALVRFPLECDDDDQEGTWNEILLVILKYINKHLHLPKREHSVSLVTESP